MKATANYVLRWAIFWLFVLAAIPLTELSGQELVQVDGFFPQYELSNIKAIDSSIGKVISIDYKRTQEGLGAGTINLRARSDNGKMSVLGVSLDKESGTIQLEESSSPFIASSFLRGHFNGDEIEGIEFYVAATLPEFRGIDFMISNPIRDGNLSSQVVARPLSETEKEKLNEVKKLTLPPQSAPAGHSLTKPKTDLVPGAPVMYGVRGQWKPAIVVYSKGNSVKLKPTDAKTLVTLAKGPYISVADKTKKMISENPQQFSLDFLILPNGNLVLDDDLVPVQDWPKLVIGTPLKREMFGKWEDVYFESFDEMFVHFYAKSPFGRSEFASRNSVAIQKGVLDQLSNKDAAEKFARNIPDRDENSADPSGFSIRDNFAELRKKQAEIHKKNLAMADKMFEDNRSSSSFGSFDLDSETDDPDFESESDSGKNADPESRVWTDKNGKFKIEAILVEQQEDRIRLKRKDGKIVEVLINKLSTADKEYLGKTNGENPFGNIVPESSSPLKKK